MSGECDECGEHTVECTCDNNLEKLTVAEMAISEEIQTMIAPVILKFIKTKRPIIDALDWILTVIVNDHRNELDTYENSWKKDMENLFIDDPFYTGFFYTGMTEGEEDCLGGYICRPCAFRMNAVPPKDHTCTWHKGICDFCGEDANLCHTSDWNWPDRRYLEVGREF